MRPVEELYENLEDVYPPKGTRKKLEDGRESAFMSLELARMRFDVTGRVGTRRALKFEGHLAPEPGGLSDATSSGASNHASRTLPVVGGEELPKPDKCYGPSVGKSRRAGRCAGRSIACRERRHAGRRTLVRRP